MSGALSRLWLAVATLLLLLAVRVAEPAPLMALRLQGFDLLTRVIPRPLEAGIDGRLLHTVVIDIDDESLKRLGQWPWPRPMLARLVDRLFALGADSVAFDMVFPEADRNSPGEFARSHAGLPAEVQTMLSALPENDAIFARAIAGRPVVLGQAGTVDTVGANDRDRPPPPQRLIVRTAEGAPDPTVRFHAFDAMLRSLPLLEDAAAGLGQVVPTADADGVIRRVPMVLKVRDQLIPALSVELLRVMAKARLAQVATDPETGRPRLLISLGRGRGVLPIPLNADGTMQAWFNPSEAGRSLLLPAYKVLDGSAARAAVDGKLVLIGTSAAGLADNRNTPIGVIPGVEIHAQLLETILGGRFIRQADNALALELAILFVTGILVISTVPFLSPRASLPLLPLLLLLLGGGAFLLFRRDGLLVDAIYPMAGAVLLHGQSLYGNFAAAERKRRQLRMAFSQFLSPALVRQLAEAPDRLKLGGETRDMTFLFTDIAGFTGFTEKTKPEDLVRLLNAYLDEACGIVMEHGGTIDKIVGDAIHAMFNAPLDQADHAARAVACALALDAYGRRFQAAARAEGFDFGETRIGLNAGPAVVGNFGGARRFDYTAHGDAINTAARMESVNKHLGTTVCVSGPVVERQGSEADFRRIGVLVLKGKTEGIPAYEPVPEAERGSEWLRRYRRAHALMAAKDPATLSAFTDLFKDHPDDPVIAFHLRRLSAGEQGEIIHFSEK